MGKINPVFLKAKNGIEVELTTPLYGEGVGVHSCVTDIIRMSPHLLTTLDEFKYTVEQEDKMLQDYYQHPDKVIITPKVKGKIVGMLDFSCGHRKRMSHQGEFGMSVHPDYQGLGIGKMMLETLIHWCEQNPRIEILKLRVFGKNHRAINLYKNFGFKEDGRDVRGIKYEDQSYDDIVSMSLFIASF